jgi:hypothetical protein
MGVPWRPKRARVKYPVLNTNDSAADYVAKMVDTTIGRAVSTLGARNRIRKSEIVTFPMGSKCDCLLMESIRRARLLVSFAVACAWCGCGGGGVGVPPQDWCDSPSASGIDAIELGAADPSTLAGGRATFAPLVDGATVRLVIGGQGLAMAGWMLRLHGAAAPSCVAQMLEIHGPDASGADYEVARSAAPLSTHADGGDARVTHPLWLPGAYHDGAPIRVTATAGAASVTVNVIAKKN